MREAKKFFRIPENQAPFAAGKDKEVFDDPLASDKIIKMEKRPVSETRGKMGFYLTKILHILFPENIPDIHLYSGQYGVTRHEKKELDKEHDTSRELWNSFQHRELTGQELGQLLEIWHTIDSWPGLAEVKERMRQLGIGIDEEAINFGKDRQANVVYVDSFVPSIGDFLIYPEKIREAIDNGISDPDSKKQAYAYLERLVELDNKRKQK